MTEETINQEPAGRRLDSWIAEHIFGLHKQQRKTLFFYGLEESQDPSRIDYCWDWFDQNGNCAKCERYSTEYQSAWLIAEKLAENEYVKVNVSVSHYHGYSCTIRSAHKSQMWPADVVRKDATVVAETMPLAVCRAALLCALMGD